MFFYITGRRGGKTTKIIDWFCEDPGGRVILTASAQMRGVLARQIQERFPDRDMRPFFDNILVATPHAFNVHVLRGSRRKVAIDDLDAILQSLFGGGVEFVTATGTEFYG